MKRETYDEKNCFISFSFFYNHDYYCEDLTKTSNACRMQWNNVRSYMLVNMKRNQYEKYINNKW
jgi:hypothetical protein